MSVLITLLSLAWLAFAGDALLGWFLPRRAFFRTALQILVPSVLILAP